MLIQNGEASEMREALVMAGDDGIYLLMTYVVTLWSTRPWPTYTENCYCLIYCNPFAMSEEAQGTLFYQRENSINVAAWYLAKRSFSA